MAIESEWEPHYEQDSLEFQARIIWMRAKRKISARAERTKLYNRAIGVLALIGVLCAISGFQPSSSDDQALLFKLASNAFGGCALFWMAQLVELVLGHRDPEKLTLLSAIATAIKEAKSVPYDFHDRQVNAIREALQSLVPSPFPQRKSKSGKRLMGELFRDGLVMPYGEDDQWTLTVLGHRVADKIRDEDLYLV